MNFALSHRNIRAVLNHSLVAREKCSRVLMHTATSIEICASNSSLSYLSLASCMEFRLILIFNNKSDTSCHSYLPTNPKPKVHPKASPEVSIN